MLAALAVAIEATGARRREDLLRLGRLQLEVGGPGDPELLTRAARRAQEVFDLGLSARLAQAALDAGGGADAGLVLGEATFRSGQHREAESVLAGLVPLCQTDAERARIASARAHVLHNLLGDPAAATVVLDQALAVVTETGPRLQLLGRLATMTVLEGDPRGALAAAEPLLASDDDVMISRGSYVSSIALALTGRSEEAVSVAYRGLETHRQASGVTQLPEAQLIGAVFGHAAAGRFARAEADAATGYQGSLAAGDKDAQATFLFQTGWVLVEQGQLARASRAFLDGASVNREIHDLAGLRWCLAGIALAEAMGGHADQAVAAAAERDELPVGSLAMYETDLIERSRAWVSACTGELSRAREILAAAAARAAAAQLRIAEARLLHDLARLGQPGEVASRLTALAQMVDGEFVAALAAHAVALSRGDAAGIEAAGRALDALGASLLASEAYAAAAAVYRSAGLARLATSAGRRAAELAAACGNLSPMGLVPGQATGRLTPREREVAGLAAAGASSRDIAAKLVLSIRTVDNHLQSAYTKLGVSSRDELAQILGS
jgi:DNA-binding CsgD family transcriptional regulator